MEVGTGECLREILLKRKSKNTAYSANAFARDLGISRAYLSLLLAGKRSLPEERAFHFASILKLDRIGVRRLVKAARFSASAKSGQLSAGTLNSLHLPLELERFRAIADWHHTAILDLSTTKGFRSDETWIARRLGISKIEVTDAIARLLKLGLLERENQKLVKTEMHLYVATRHSDAAVRSHHQQMIGKGLEALKQRDGESFARRSISGMTLAIKASRLEEARRRIEIFQREFAEFVTEGDDCDEVFQLNVQFFPLTKGTQKI